MSEGATAALSLVCPRCRQGLDAAPRGRRCARCDVVYPERDGILRLVAGRLGPPGFDPHYFDSLARVEKRHFWFVARREVILAALRLAVPDLAGRRLFDIGCGSGGLLEFLGQSGVPLAGACDAYLESLEMVRRRVSVPLVLVDEGRLPPLGPGQSLLSLFDVLEHLDDDEGTLNLLFSSLGPGGVLILTVPGHPFLFDEMDELAHHRRRYRRAELRGKLEAAGFEIRILTHFMSPLVPLLVPLRWLGRRLFGRRRRCLDRRNLEFRIVPVLNGALGGLLALERLCIGRFALPFGSSIVAVAARPGAASPGPPGAL
jgi:SAM-dependent methyltransferase